MGFWEESLTLSIWAHKDKKRDMAYKDKKKDMAQYYNVWNVSTNVLGLCLGGFGSFASGAVSNKCKITVLF